MSHTQQKSQRLQGGGGLYLGRWWWLMRVSLATGARELHVRYRFVLETVRDGMRGLGGWSDMPSVWHVCVLLLPSHVVVWEGGLCGERGIIPRCW